MEAPLTSAFVFLWLATAIGAAILFVRMRNLDESYTHQLSISAELRVKVAELSNDQKEARDLATHYRSRWFRAGNPVNSTDPDWAKYGND